MEKALAVANAMIMRACNHQNPPTQMKLQKLIYFAHGWHLALYDGPLVDEQFQAWPYGPVLPSVYHEFKAYGISGIDKLGTEIVVLPTGGFGWDAPKILDSSGFITPLLDKIWEVFGSYSGGQLSDMTHATNSPWKQIHDLYGNTRDVVIPDNLIKNYFKGLMSHAQ